MGFLLQLGVNILSSILYDIGKTYITNNCDPLSEQQLIEIINLFQDKIDELSESQQGISDRLNYLQMQNQMIIKLMLTVFDCNCPISFTFSQNGYRLDGNYSLSNLDETAFRYISAYSERLQMSHPKTLGEAIWPIPFSVKEELFNEIQQRIIDDENSSNTK